MEFTQSEIDTVKKHLDARWKGENMEIHLADIEYTKKKEQASAEYPALVWETSQATFVVLKLASFSYKGFFYVGENERFDAGEEEYSDLNVCTESILKAQANLALSKNVTALKK